MTIPVQMESYDKKIFKCPIENCLHSCASKATIIKHLKLQHPDETTEKMLNDIDVLWKKLRQTKYQYYKLKNKNKNNQNTLKIDDDDEDEDNDNDMTIENCRDDI